MAKTYKVLAPYVTLRVKDQAGGTVITGFYAGAVLDADQVDEVDLQRHLDDDLMVEEGDKVAETFAVPAGTPLPGQPPNAPVAERATTAQPVPPLSDEQVEAAEGSRTRSSRRSSSRSGDEAKG